MYRKIMVPIDLAHAGSLDKAIDTASDLAKHYGIPIRFVGVTAETPTEVAHTPEEFADKLAKFAAAEAEKHGLEIDSKAYPSHDPTVDLDNTLLTAADEIGADLIVVGSHIPGFREHIFASHAGTLASHAEVSVFVVR